MGEHNSPYFAAGCADGERDTELMGSCPGLPPVGMDPEKEWSWMYRRGYERTFTPGFHFPCPDCKKEKERENAQ